MENLFDQIRQQTSVVARQARAVHVLADRISEYARSLPFEKLATPTLDPSSHFIGSSKDTIAFFLTLDSINFGSGYFPHLSKLPGKSGYFTIATRLTDRFKARGPIGADELLGLTRESCRAIFHQPPDDPAVNELMSLFASALNDLGKLLLESFGGEFTALIESANHSTQRLVRILDCMTFFHDVQQYDGIDVPFYKRAQLLAADLNLALRGEGLGRFDDLNELTIFADNLVPHVLRCDGVIEYERSLADKIHTGELLEKNGREEIEMRACAVHVCERLVESLRNDGRAITAMQIDYLLWNRGQSPEYKARSRHRCRTWFY